jgi:hypothetical protein
MQYVTGTENGPNEVFDVDGRKVPGGRYRCDYIAGASPVDGGQFIVVFKGLKHPRVLSREVVNRVFPLKVIKFYEDRMMHLGEVEDFETTDSENEP